MNSSLILGSLATVGAVVYALTGSLRVSLAAGIAAASCAWGAVSIVTGRWRRAASSLGLEPDDVADALKAEVLRRRALEDQVVLLRAVVNSLPGALWVTSRDGTLVEHNHALSALLARAPGSRLVGFSVRELVRDAQVLAAIERAALSGEPVSATLESAGLHVRIASLSGLPGSVALFTAH